MSDILTIKELSEYLKISDATLYKLANGGRIPSFKVANEWRFDKKSIESWIRRQEEGDLL